MDLKKVSVIMAGFLAIFLIIFLTNTYEQSSIIITGNVVDGQACTSPGSEQCDGKDLFWCINGQWKYIGQIPGKCGGRKEAKSNTAVKRHSSASRLMKGR